MIPTRIDKKAGVRDNYSHLAEYISAAREEGEKLKDFWIEGCNAGDGLDDLETALVEIEAVRKMKPDIDDKTYHLVVSLSPGEGEKLSKEDWQNIEREFAKALGFSDHQRVAGVHINTDKMHMHVAYNMVNPHTMKLHRPYQDFPAIGKVARAMEAKYGLIVAPGITDGKDKIKGSKAAKDFEARTWQQSFETHLLAQREDLMKVIVKAQSWEDLHKGFAEFGIEARLRGNGMVLAQANGKQAMKASLLDRSASLAALEKRFGDFEPAQEQIRLLAASPPPHRRYRAVPIRQHPAQGPLWRNFKRQRRKTLVDRVLDNWQSYLLAACHLDPTAMTLILVYQELFHTIGSFLPAPRPLPPNIGPAMSKWRESGHWAPISAKGPQASGPGCRLDDVGNLVIPFRDEKNHLRGVRIIDRTGKALDIDNVAGRSIRHVVGKMTPDSQAVFVTADYNLAVALHRAAKTPVVVVTQEASIPAMVGDLRRGRPDLVVTLAAETHLKAAEKAAREAKANSILWTESSVVLDADRPQKTVRKTQKDQKFIEPEDQKSTPSPRKTKARSTPKRKPGLER